MEGFKGKNEAKKEKNPKQNRCKALTAVFAAVRLWGQVHTRTNKCSNGTHILAVPS